MGREIQIGVLGLGVVGSGAVAMLRENRELIARRVGASIAVRKIAVRDPDKPRAVTVERSLLTYNSYEVLDDPHVEVICELIGGVYPTKEYVLRALQNGKHVVTANKELLAKEGGDLLAFAAQRGLDFQFEGSVGGGIPIVQAMRNALSGNRISRVVGIVNGTTNYILSRMTDAAMPFQTALREAQAAGYAEADPTSDVGGHDAAYKLAILSGLAFDCRVREASVYREGVDRVHPEDVAAADRLGFVIKLLAIAKRSEDGGIEARAHPTLIPKSHPLAAVSDTFNAIAVRGDFVGDVMITGRGAGSFPTGSAVVGDLIDICRNIMSGATGRGTFLPGAEVAASPVERIESRYYARLCSPPDAPDPEWPANFFCDHGVALAERRSLEAGQGDCVVLTEPVAEAVFLKAIKSLEDVHGATCIHNWLRVEVDL